MIDGKGGICLTWLDNGTTDGKFTEGLVKTLLSTYVPIVSSMRIYGIQISKQRQEAFDFWLDNTKEEWMLWIDSDIHLTDEVLNILWDSVDKDARPIVSGVYFTNRETQKNIIKPLPCVFNFNEEQTSINHIHPLPINSLIKIDCSGFGLLLMHRSVGERMRSYHYPRKVFFNEFWIDKTFVSEDVSFFKYLYQIGIPVYAHSGAIANHVKKISLDLEYYNEYWNKIAE